MGSVPTRPLAPAPALFSPNDGPREGGFPGPMDAARVGARLAGELAPARVKLPGPVVVVGVVTLPGLAGRGDGGMIFLSAGGRV
jgi:hypothetical protein